VTYSFCEELVFAFLGAEFIRRKKGGGFEMGRIAGWVTDRGYQKMLVVNEDVKQQSRSFVLCRVLSLPSGPRCDHVNSPPEWIDGALQVDID